MILRDAQASDVHEEVAKDVGVVKFVTGGTRPAVVDKGLFFVGGPAWKRIRTLMTPAFTSSKLKHVSLNLNTVVSLKYIVTNTKVFIFLEVNISYQAILS